MLYVFLFIFILGCDSVPLKSPPKWVGFTQTGKASFYAMKYQFRKTASGERFNQLAKTAAHCQLPFGTKARVTNLENGKSVLVTVKDRSPFVAGRAIDLSRAAFRKIGNTTDSGTIRVRIKVVE